MVESSRWILVKIVPKCYDGNDLQHMAGHYRARESDDVVALRRLRRARIRSRSTQSQHTHRLAQHKRFLTVLWSLQWLWMPTIWGAVLWFSQTLNKTFTPKYPATGCCLWSCITIASVNRSIIEMNQYSIKHSAVTLLPVPSSMAKCFTAGKIIVLNVFLVFYLLSLEERHTTRVSDFWQLADSRLTKLKQFYIRPDPEHSSFCYHAFHYPFSLSLGRILSVIIFRLCYILFMLQLIAYIPDNNTMA